MSDSTLTVAMTSYNHAKYIGEALEAIVERKHPLRRMIIYNVLFDSTEHRRRVT